MEELELNPATRIMWKTVKPLLMGRILYAPDSPAVRQIIKNVSARDTSILRPAVCTVGSIIRELDRVLQLPDFHMSDVLGRERDPVPHVMSVVLYVGVDTGWSNSFGGAASAGGLVAKDEAR